MKLQRSKNINTWRESRSTASAFLAFCLLGCVVLYSAAAAADESTSTVASADTKTSAGAADAAALDSPIPTIAAFHAGLLDLMKNAKQLGFQGRVDKLAPLMADTFDLEFMASKTVGRHWRELSDADKARWAETFARFTTANYAGRFTDFTGEEFITVGVEDAARDTQVVLTKIIVPKGDDVQLNYRVIKRDGEWKVIDVYLNGTVSELALRRSEYSSALKRDGFEQLVASVETKIEDLKSKGRADG
jgi:phospholipid transport system substrate-binding protein